MVLAIEFLHASGLAHRNVKPENALVNINGYLRLANFGASKLVGRGRTYTLCGTPDYMAPELVTFKGYGLTVDFWSLGVVLYEMVAGRLPFAAPDVGALFENIARGRYNVSASFSPPLRSLIRGLIQASPAKYYYPLTARTAKEHSLYQWRIYGYRIPHALYTPYANIYTLGKIFENPYKFLKKNCPHPPLHKALLNTPTVPYKNCSCKLLGRPTNPSVYRSRCVFVPKT